MMDMNGMVDRCMDVMGSMIGGRVMLVLFLVWVVGLGIVGTLLFWGVRRFTGPHV